MSSDSTALTPEQMAATIADLEKQLGKGGKLSFEVSEKGAVSVYGLGRFPVTLCYEQWNACSRMSNSCKCFLKKTDLDSIQLYCSTLVSL